MSSPITVSFQNTGSQAFVKGLLGQQLNLGINDDASSWSSFAASWPTADRVAVQSEPKVSPGETVSFTFRVRAPAKPGTYVLRLRPVVDGTLWLDDQGVFVKITVVP